MFKKIAVAALISGFTIASFAQAGAIASPPSKTAAPATAASIPTANEQKTETPKPAKHMKHRHHKKTAAKADTSPAPVAPAKK